jgi:hypothetical protein
LNASGLRIKYVFFFPPVTRCFLIVIQILSFNADNATSNDAQTTSLAIRDNSFEEANRVRCFNHTLQLSGKTLLKPFNAGMSSGKTAQDESLVDDNNLPNMEDLEDDDDDVGDSAGDGEDGENDDDDDIDELEELDEMEREQLLADTAVVRQTVTKVCQRRCCFI